MSDIGRDIATQIIEKHHAVVHIHSAGHTHTIDGCERAGREFKAILIRIVTVGHAADGVCLGSNRVV